MSSVRVEGVAQADALTMFFFPLDVLDLVLGGKSKGKDYAKRSVGRI